MKNIYGDYTYTPCVPCADTDELAEASPRLMYRHLRNYEKGVEVFMAPRHVLTAGWVIGIMDNHNTLPVS